MYSVQLVVSDGTLTRFPLSIKYFAKEDITLYRNLSTTPLVLGTDWQWDGATHINLLTDSPVPAGSYITVRRNTNIDRAFNIYDGGAAFTRDTLDENFKQMIYLAQEFTEGNGLTGLFFPLNMRGFKITDLGAGESVGDAVNRGQLDAVATRVDSLENTFVGSTVSYPWYVTTTASTDTIEPPYVFTKAALFLNGVCQTPGYSYLVVDNTIMLADPVPVGTHVFVRIGEDVGLDTSYATTDQLANAILDAEGEHSSMRAEWQADDAVVQADVSTRARAGVNSDITSLTGLTTALSTEQGGTGNTVGTVARLTTPRTLSVDLTSTATPSFDGTTDVVQGVLGVLPVSKGGTGASTASLARTALGSTSIGDAVFVASNAASARSTLSAAVMGSNNDITALTNLSGGVTGITTGVAASSGIVGEVASAESGSATSLVSGSAVNIVSLSLPAGDWELESTFQIINSGNVTALAFGVSTTTGTLPATWYDVYSITTTIGSGTSNRQGMARRVLLSTTTTVYLVAQATFTGTATANGYVRARRVR